MANTNKDGTISSDLVLRRSFDKVEDAIRFTPAASVGFDIAFETVSGSSAVITSATPIGTIIASANCKEVERFQLYSNTLTAITGTCTAAIEVSPSDVDSVWFQVVTLNSSATAGVVTSSPLQNVAARRVRVVLTVAPTTGTAQFYIVGK